MFIMLTDMDMLMLNLKSVVLLFLYARKNQVSENIFPWKARIMGDPDSLYAGGEFLVDIHFPLNYPFVPPKVLHQLWSILAL
ncbi:hypothetical protein RHGRI_020549 [Rhododendron griersonianum]|uniref:UBC core domain-containing protein n=1 Tax=Rhododendron griersonianum TaxID=479676 RepID=A0AAV6JGS7_9ERIC|nr:hypothetical protein RHGRI_020549 [Rhododendron griersonianum]